MCHTHTHVCVVARWCWGRWFWLLVGAAPPKLRAGADGKMCQPQPCRDQSCVWQCTQARLQSWLVRSLHYVLPTAAGSSDSRSSCITLRSHHQPLNKLFDSAANTMPPVHCCQPQPAAAATAEQALHLWLARHASAGFAAASWTRGGVGRGCGAAAVAGFDCLLQVGYLSGQCSCPGAPSRALDHWAVWCPKSSTRAAVVAVSPDEEASLIEGPQNLEKTLNLCASLTLCCRHVWCAYASRWCAASQLLPLSCGKAAGP